MPSTGGARTKISDLRAYAPNGKRIIFNATVGDDPPFSTQLFTINADGTNPVQLTDGTDDPTDPAYSPDGKRIAYTSHTGKRGSKIVIADADGGDPHVAIKNAFNISGISG